ncbi:MAG: transglutaminase-like domain-containing protein [Proteobacteria bacterium]|nr:transglutaminase-like domain-containing protein [Pseudomonadota bacterium]
MKKIFLYAAILVSAGVFAVLMVMRTGGPGPGLEAGALSTVAAPGRTMVFQGGLPPEGGPKESDAWLSVLQDDRRIGWAHRKLSWAGSLWQMEEVAFLRVKTMGTAQEVLVTTSAELAPDLTLRSFAFTLGSDLANFSVKGEMGDGKLALTTGNGPEAVQSEIAFSEPLYLGGSLLYASEVARLAPGEKRSFPLFDPATLGTSPATVEVVGIETLVVMGEERTARRVKLDFMGSSQLAWIGEDGDILAEEGLLGLRLTRTDRDTALALAEGEAGTDLVEMASVPLDRPIQEPGALASLSLKVEGADDHFDGLSGGRQTWDGEVLTVTRETLPPADYALETDPAFGDEQREFLAPGPFIRSDHPEVEALAEEIVSPDDPPLAQAKKIVDWAYKNLEKKPVFSVPDALGTLRSRAGDCNEHAVLVAALARAAGVPARMEVGLTYLRGRFYYHAWNAFWLGEWVTADSVFGQFPADVTHLRFARGNPDAQLRIMGLLGRVKLSWPEPAE